MTIGHTVGSLSIASRLSGTVRSSRVGSFGSGKVYGGTFSLSASGGNVGSFGSAHAGVVRAAKGSFHGTLIVKALGVLSYPGTIRTRPNGSIHVWYAAPPRPRFITVRVSLSPSALTASDAVVRQSLMRGTIAYASAGAETTSRRDGATLRGWVLPGRGSYVVGSTSGNLAPAITRWSEWDP